MRREVGELRVAGLVGKVVSVGSLGEVFTLVCAKVLPTIQV